MPTHSSLVSSNNYFSKELSKGVSFIAVINALWTIEEGSIIGLSLRLFHTNKQLMKFSHRAVDV